MTEIFHHTLPCGLRLCHVRTASAVGWCGLAVNAGSRDDLPGLRGLAHFVEHTIFKGTRHRRAWHILNRMETVGGELNAYTTKEGTMLYSQFPAQHLERAVELLADLVQWSVFPPAELERETDVVLEEVEGYRDSPIDAIYDDFEDMVFAGNGMGHNILGLEPEVRRITSQDCQNYLSTQYVPGNMVFFSTGPEQPERVFRLAEKHLGGMHHSLQRCQRVAPPVLAPRHEQVQAGHHQCHTLIGARVPSIYSDQRFALALLNNLLGGPGMNSLLNVRIRERHGLAYTVESSVAGYTDCGLLLVYCGCERHNLQRCHSIVARTIAELAESPLSERRLEACKKQYCGQLQVAAANPETQAMSAGRSLLYWGKVSPTSSVIERVQAVSAEQLRQVAEMAVMERCSSLSYV